MKPKVFFSAPSDFIDLTAFEDILSIEREEVWYAGDLTPNDAQAWVPNPGQHFVVDAHVLDLFPHLRLIATPSTGTNHIHPDICESRGVEVMSLLDARQAMERISASAEFTFLHLLNALRRFQLGVTRAKEGRWRSDEHLLRGRELQGRAVGLVGYGRIGRRLSAYLHAFGASVQAFDPYVRCDEMKVKKASDIRSLFRSSEIAIVCCALTDETRGLVNGELLRLLPNKGVLVNTARGEVLDESSICTVLETRQDITLSVDVLDREVTNEHSGSCLWRLCPTGRVIITPHMAGVTVESQQKAAEIALGLVASALL